ncbi:flavin monoamine oxidase family protein [Lentzea sp. NPDC054927]
MTGSAVGPRRAVNHRHKSSTLALADGVLHELEERAALARKDSSPDISLGEALREILASRELSHEDEQAMRYRDQSVLDALAEGLDIRLGHVVTRIEDGRVTTDQGVFCADKVLVTLPIGVLKAGSVEFDPPLAEAKQSAIARLGFGTLNKIALHYPEAFWPQDQYVFGYLCRDTDRHPTVVISMWKSHGKPILVMQLGASLGREVKTWSSDDVSTYATSVVQDLFGAQVPEPLSVSRTSWSADPYALGSYALGSYTLGSYTLGSYTLGSYTLGSYTLGSYTCIGVDPSSKDRISGDSALYTPPSAGKSRRPTRNTDRMLRFVRMRMSHITSADLIERSRACARALIRTASGCSVRWSTPNWRRSRPCSTRSHTARAIRCSTRTTRRTACSWSPVARSTSAASTNARCWVAVPCSGTTTYSSTPAPRR